MTLARTLFAAALAGASLGCAALPSDARHVALKAPANGGDGMAVIAQTRSGADGTPAGLVAMITLHDRDFVPVPADGAVSCYLYENASSGQAEPDRIWRFTAEEVAAAQSPSDLGSRVHLWMPFDEPLAENASGAEGFGRLVVRYDANDGTRLANRTSVSLKPGNVRITRERVEASTTKTEDVAPAAPAPSAPIRPVPSRPVGPR